MVVKFVMSENVELSEREIQSIFEKNLDKLDDTGLVHVGSLLNLTKIEDRHFPEIRRARSVRNAKIFMGGVQKSCHEDLILVKKGCEGLSGLKGYKSFIMPIVVILTALSHV